MNGYQEDWDDERDEYGEDGCDIAPHCVECPLPACRYDMGPKQAHKWLRAIEVQAALLQGLSADRIAESLGISRRSVFRLKQMIAAQDRPGPAWIRGEQRVVDDVVALPVTGTGASGRCPRCRGRLAVERQELPVGNDLEPYCLACGWRPARPPTPEERRRA